jgi:hypothetical protein
LTGLAAPPNEQLSCTSPEADAGGWPCWTDEQTSICAVPRLISDINYSADGGGYAGQTNKILPVFTEWLMPRGWRLLAETDIYAPVH